MSERSSESVTDRSGDQRRGWWGVRTPAPTNARPCRALRGRWLVLSLAQDGLRLFDSDNGRLAELTGDGPPATRRAEIATALARTGRPTTRRRPVCLRLSPEFALTRHLRIPRAALPEARRIALLDLEQTTPLRAADVLTAIRFVPPAYAQGEAGGGIAAIEQRVVKLSVLRDVERLLRDAGRRVERIDCWDQAPGGESAPTAVDIDLMERVAPAPGSGRAVMLLAAAALTITVATAALLTLRLDNTLAAVRAETAELRRRHDVGLAALKQRDEKLRATADLIGVWQAQPSAARVLDSLTRLLPDTNHVTSLVLRGSTLELAGYTASSAGLLFAMERSGWLTNATLTTAATFEEASGRERFSLRAQVGPHALSPLSTGHQTR